MTNTDHQKLWVSWMERSVSWWLDDAIRLLFGYDPDEPKIDAEQLALEGNDILVRAGISARKAIAAGGLIPINERTRSDNAKDYLVHRDDFVDWAKNEFPADGGELHEVWKQYKVSRPKVGQLSKLEKNKIEWQAEVDTLYIRQFKELGKVPTHSSICKQAEQTESGSEGTIRRHTNRRNRAWLIEQIKHNEKSQT